MLRKQAKTTISFFPLIGLCTDITQKSEYNLFASVMFVTELKVAFSSEGFLVNILLFAGKYKYTVEH